MLSRIEYIKSFIDYISEQYPKMLYKIYREEGYSPLGIYNTDGWTDRKFFLTSSSNYCGNDDINDYLRDGFLEVCDYCEDSVDIYCGLQQFAFIFDDIVYKISSIEMDGMIGDFLDDLPDKYREIFAEYKYIDTYKHCYIYTQERVYEHKTYYDYYKVYKERFEDVSEYEDTFEMALSLERGQEFCNEFIDACYDACMGCWDLHGGNWGVDIEGKIKIFDPIYDDNY